jgi:NAD(P)-dependent dehydrogenase (short-subunit alcohol dehydrogenase family)
VFIGIGKLAGITAFLMSPAARNIHGQAIIVDGGWTAQWSPSEGRTMASKIGTTG